MAIEEKVIQPESVTNAEQPVAETASQPTQPQAPDLTSIKAEYESQLNALKKQVAEEQEKFKGAKGRKLNSMECHDIVCKTGEVVVVGGVRRSAMISLSNLSDIRMRHAKTGQWWETAPHMALSNNSVAYTDKPDSETFLREWTSLVESKSGERGIFNRVSAQKQAAKNGRRIQTMSFGTNPCSEIILRPHQFCNLTEVVVKEHDTDDDLDRKVRLATILGTAQSTLTNFPLPKKSLEKQYTEERLLGVSLTGIMDNIHTNCFLVNMRERLTRMKQIAIDTNKKYAKKIWHRRKHSHHLCQTIRYSITAMRFSKWYSC